MDAGYRTERATALAVVLASAKLLGQSAPMVVAIRAAESASGGSALLHTMTMLVEVGAIEGLSSVMVVMMMAQPRIFYSMANDGLLPPFAKKIHPRFRTPHLALILQCVWAIVLVAWGTYEQLFTYVVFAAWIFYALTAFAVIILRRKLPDLNPALNADGSINKGKALRIMLGSPILTARAISANNRAARHLAKALSKVLSADFPCLR